MNRTGGYRAVTETGARTAVFLLPVLAVLSARAMAPALPVLALLLVFLHRQGTGRFPDWRIAGVGCLAAFLAWALIAVAWTILPGGEIVGWLRVFAICVAGVALWASVRGLSGAVRHRLASAFLAGFALSIVFLLVERLTGGVIGATLRDWTGGEPMNLTRLKPGLTILTLLAWPAAAEVSARWGTSRGLLLLAIGFGVIVSFDGISTIVAAGAGAAAFTVALGGVRRAAWAICVAAVCLVSAAPLAVRWLPTPEAVLEAFPNFPFHQLHRPIIWQFTGSAIGEHPVRGWGFDAARDVVAYKEKTGALVRRGAGITTLALTPGTGLERYWIEFYRNHPLPLHPHNFALQLWLELGAIGVALAIVTLWRLTGTLRRSEEPVGSYAVAGLASGVAAASLNYGVWQNWWLSLLWIAVAMTALVGWRRADGDHTL